jgi:hypothetical protein
MSCLHQILNLPPQYHYILNVMHLLFVLFVFSSSSLHIERTGDSNAIFS